MTANDRHHQTAPPGTTDLRSSAGGPPEVAGNSETLRLERELRRLVEAYPGAAGSIPRAGSRLAIRVTAPSGGSPRFGLWLSEMDRQGQLAWLVASYLALVHEVLVEVTAPRGDALEVFVSEQTTPTEIDALTAGLEAALSALARRRSDVLLRHLSGASFELPYVQDEHSEAPHADARTEATAVISVLFRPRDAASLAGLDSSLLAYDNESAAEVGHVLSDRLQPFRLDSATMELGSEVVRVEHYCLPNESVADADADVAAILGMVEAGPRSRVAACPKVASWLDGARAAPSRRFDGSSTSTLLLRLALTRIIEAGRLREHGFVLEIVGADPSTELALRAAVGETPHPDGETSPVEIVALFPAAQLEAVDLRPDSVVVDIFQTLDIHPTPEVLVTNILHVRAISVALAGKPVITTPGWGPERVEPALVEALLAELGSGCATEVGEQAQVEVQALRGFWGDLDANVWRAFHRRRRGQLPRWQPGREAIAANPPLDSPPSEAFNLCDHVFRRAHIRSASRLVDARTGSAVSYAELQAMAASYARRFRSLGLQAGAVVGLVARDAVSTAAVVAACLSGGWIFAPLNYHASLADFEVMLEAARPELLLCERAVAAQYARAMEGVTSAELETFLPASTSDEVAAELSSTPLPPETPAAILFTSGSTGTAKAVTHSHADFIVCSQNYAARVVGLSPEDCVYTPSPTFFAYGLHNLLLSLLAGASHVIGAPAGGATGVTEVLLERDVTVLFTVPAVYKLMLPRGRSSVEFPSLRLCVSAGEKLPSKLHRAAREFLGVTVLDGIGCTEAIATFISNRPSYVAPGCTGVLTPGFSAKLLNRNGEACRVGEVGVLWIRGDTLTPRYSTDDDLTRERFVDGWFDTRDMFFVDAQRRFYNVGRAGSAIKINACWLAPDLMESALLSHPAVLECAVCMVADDYGLLRPKALVVLRDPERHAPDPAPLWAELQALSREALGKDNYPHLFEATDALPRTASGKLIRSRRVPERMTPRRVPSLIAPSSDS